MFTQKPYQHTGFCITKSKTLPNAHHFLAWPHWLTTTDILLIVRRRQEKKGWSPFSKRQDKKVWLSLFIKARRENLTLLFHKGKTGELDPSFFIISTIDPKYTWGVARRQDNITWTLPFHKSKTRYLDPPLHEGKTREIEPSLLHRFWFEKATRVGKSTTV